MKNFPGGKVALALVALLAVSFVLLVFAKDEPRTNPTIESTNPSGLGAFAELLRRDGYRVVLDRQPRPKLESGDLVVDIDMSFYVYPPSDDSVQNQVKDAVLAFLQKGGSELRLRLPPSFDDLSQSAHVVSLAPLPGLTPRQMTVSTYDDTVDMSGDGQAVGQPLNTRAADGSWMDGKRIEVYHSLGATNRFIGKGDNAEVFLDYVHMLAPPGSKVVFAEAAINNVREEGPLEALGSWAVAGRTQFGLLILVVLSTVAIRFGSPISDRVHQRSARDMVDAVAEVLRKGGKAQFALEMSLDDTFDRFRLGIGAPLGTTKEHLKERMPQPLLVEVMQAEELLAHGIQDNAMSSRRKALSMVQSLDKQATLFERDTRQRRHPVS